MADKAVNLAGPNMQAQIIDRFFVSINLCKMLNFQHQIHSFQDGYPFRRFVWAKVPMCLSIIAGFPGLYKLTF